MRTSKRRREADLPDRVAALQRAAEAAHGRVDDAVVERATAVAERAGSRLRLADDHTVVALAGATGSGKSSALNALVGVDVVGVGVRRPTTSVTTACVAAEHEAGDLLDWLQVPPRHRVSRSSLLDPGPGEQQRGQVAQQLDGTVLLDLPDHDSTETQHHHEVDRLVELADVFCWVLDPQKYADAAVHERYLAPLRDHQERTVVVLNQVDTLPQARVETLRADLERLLAEDGLPDVTVLATSTATGDGVAELRGEITRRAADRRAARDRLRADVDRAAAELAEACGPPASPELSAGRREELDEALAQAAGVPTVTDAVERASRTRVRRATGWPPVSWLSRLRPDPLRRLHLDPGEEDRQLTGTPRASVPGPTPVQRARVDAAVREVADDVTGEMAPGWQTGVRRASVSRLDDVHDRLDAAVQQTDLGVTRLPLWARTVRVAQWLLLTAAVVGLLWLTAVAVLGYLQLPRPDLPGPGPVPWPTVLLVGGLLAGAVLALVSRALARWDARRRARRADTRLRIAVGAVAEELVVAPVEAELDAYREVQQALATACG